MSVPFQYGVAYLSPGTSVEPYGYFFQYPFTNSPLTTIKASVVFDGEPIIMYGYIVNSPNDSIFYVTSSNFVVDVAPLITFYPNISASRTWFFSP